MPNKKARRKFRLLIYSFAISFLLLIIFALYALRQIDANNRFSSQVDHTNSVITELYKLDIIIRELDVKERGFMLTRDSAYLTQLREVQNQVIPSTQSLKSLVDDNKTQQELLTKLRGAISMRIDAIKNNLKHLNDADANTRSQHFNEGKVFKVEALSYLKQMQTNEYKLLVNRYEQKKDSEKLAQDVLQTLLVIFFIVTLLLFVFIIRQIYIRRHFQEVLQQKVTALERTNEELEQVANVLSHDIQEPLRKIQLFSNKLSYSNNVQETKKIIERINYSSSYMQKLVEDMEVLVDLRKDSYEEHINPNRLIGNVVANLNKQIKHKQATVEVKQLPTLKGNYKQLQLLFKNLIENSLKFSKKDKHPVIIIYSDEEEQMQEYIKIVIEDNGIGFDNSYQEKIFKLFRRLHSQEEYEGKGIGLPLCKKIMNNHNGIIKANGVPDQGAIFTLYFPKN